MSTVCLKLLVVAQLASLAAAQSSTVWKEDFDDTSVYSPGQDPTQPSVEGWEQWNLEVNQGARIATGRVHSSPHSLFIGGNTDVIQRFSESSGQWVVSAPLYVSTQSPGALLDKTYFTLLNTYSPGGPKGWSLQLELDPTAGTIRFLNGPNAGILGPLFPDEWAEIRAEIDLDTDTAQVFYGKFGASLPLGPAFPWSQGAGGNGVAALAALNLRANGQPLGSGIFYDDLCVAPRVEALHWNRSVSDIEFSAGPTGLVHVTAHWGVGAGLTNVFTDLGLFVNVMVNSQVVFTTSVSATIQLVNGNCGNKPPCNMGQCDEWNIDSFAETGFCDEIGGVCECKCIGDTKSPELALVPGDLVEVTLTPTPGALIELLPGDDSRTEVFGGLRGSVSYCTPKAGLACGTPAIASAGFSSASASAGFVVSAGPARSGKTAMLLYSNQGRANLPFPPGGHILCIPAMGLRRGGPTWSGGTPGPNCDGVFGVDMNAFAQGQWVPPLGGPAFNPAAYLSVMGQRVDCQWWGRDTQATGSFMSDALEYFVGP